MLKVDDLQKKIKEALSSFIPSAIETCMKNKCTVKSIQGDKEAKEFAETFDEIVSEPLSIALASAIDYYVRNISISGTIITVGSPVSQTAVIAPAPNPSTGGKIPNTLGIN